MVYAELNTRYGTLVAYGTTRETCIGNLMEAWVKLYVERAGFDEFGAGMQWRAQGQEDNIAWDEVWPGQVRLNGEIVA